MMKEKDENGKDVYVGYCRDLLEEIRAQMNWFEFEIYEVPDNEFGSLNKDNTTWNGLIGELIDKVIYVHILYGKIVFFFY